MATVITVEDQLQIERAAHRQTVAERDAARAENVELRRVMEGTIEAANIHMNQLRAALEARS